jgi:hypothetical protein
MSNASAELEELAALDDAALRRILHAQGVFISNQRGRWVAGRTGPGTRSWRCKDRKDAIRHALAVR